MGLEVISQVLSPTNATYINGVSAERRFSAAVLKNMYQGLVEKDGRGVNDTFVSSNDAEQSAQVMVNRILPVKMQPREQGANRNGASFSANSHYVQTETVGIDILTVLDDPIIIARARQDMIKVDLLAEQTEIYSNRLKTILNGATAAAKLMAVALDKAEGKEVNEKVITSTDITNKAVLKRFIEANSLLDEGDEEHGIDLFPEDTRVAVFKPSYRAILKADGVLTLGGANYVYGIAKGGAISTEAKATKAEDGYIGDIDGVPCHLISNESLAHASEFLGLPRYELKNGGFIGYVASSYANARGVSTSKQIKIVDAVQGQGIILQPYTKFGVASWYAKGNVVLKDDADYDPIGFLKTTFAGVSGINFKLKGAGSRLFPVVPATGWTVSGSAFTLVATALDDFDTDHIKGAAFYVGDTACATVGEFAKEYATATYKGTFTVGTSKSTTIGSGKFVNAIVIADDGSVTLTSKKNA